MMQPRAEWIKETNKYKCLSCGTERSISDSHYYDTCIAIQLHQAKQEIKQLQQKVRYWNTAWLEARELAGKMYWTVPNPFYFLPSKNETQSDFFKQQYDRFILFATRLMRHAAEEQE